MGKAYRLESLLKAPTLKEIILLRHDPDVRLTTSPFGITPEEYAKNPPIYGGSAVKWKTKKGLGIDGFSRMLLGLGYPTANMQALAAGLRKARDMAVRLKGTTGTVLYNGKLYPKICIELKKAAGKG